MFHVFVLNRLTIRWLFVGHVQDLPVQPLNLRQLTFYADHGTLNTDLGQSCSMKVPVRDITVC